MCQARAPIAFHKRPYSGKLCVCFWQTSVRFPSLMSGIVVMGIGIFWIFQKALFRLSARGSRIALEYGQLKNKWLMDSSMLLHRRHKSC